MASHKNTVILLDGECALCNQFASFIYPRLHADSSLQFFGIASETGVELISHLPEDLQKVDSIYLLVNGVPYVRSTAIIKCLQLMNLPYRILGSVVYLIPKRIRNGLYDFVASKRKSIFGTTDKCIFIDFNETGENIT
ncbi:MAG: DCC1-like thiol-disulfide oxidoreductase family protein [Actinomycetota bacterium]